MNKTTTYRIVPSIRLQKGLWKVWNKTVPIGCQMNMALSKRLKLNLYSEERQQKKQTEKEKNRERNGGEYNFEPRKGILSN